MKKLFLILALITIKCTMYCQSNFSNTWLIGGTGYQIKFDNGSIIHDTILLSSITSTFFSEGKSNICDSTGNMKYLSDGFNVYHPNGSFVDGGDTLVPLDYYNYYSGFSSSSQSSLFLPMENSIYYFITPTCSDSNLANVWFGIGSNKAPFDLLLYNKIDGKLNGGQGMVVQRMQPLLENNELSKVQMMACKHGNGKDWWLFKMAGDANKVYKFLFTKDSVVNYGVQYFPYPFRGYQDLNGQMAFSKDGTKFATTYSHKYGEVLTANFDRCSGMLSNMEKLDVPPKLVTTSTGPIMDSFNGGLCFSPNGRFLYISRATHIMQYDYQDNTYYKVYELDTSTTQFLGYSSLHLAPNGKIYIGNLGGGAAKQMSVIDNPDVKGVGCNFCRKCLRSNSSYGYLTTPPCMPNYELGVDTVNQNCWAVGIEQHTLKVREWDVYPNPSSSKVYIRNAERRKKNLYNAIGQLIFSTLNNEIDVSSLSKGMYYLKCDGQSKKVIIE